MSPDDEMNECKDKSRKGRFLILRIIQNNGIKYKTIVQAKDWNSNVPQEKILAFNQILQDIPGQPRGIFITKTGYQKGAREIAEKLNIVLYELRKPTDKDWEGKMRDLKIIIHGIFPNLISCTPVLDKEYME